MYFYGYNYVLLYFDTVTLTCKTVGWSEKIQNSQSHRNHYLAHEPESKKHFDPILRRF